MGAFEKPGAVLMLSGSEIRQISERYSTGYKTIVVDGFIVNGAMDAILLQKRSSDRKLFPNFWDAFGGHVDPGEKIDEALAREIKEESRMELVEVLAFTHHFKWAEDPNIINLQFLCRAAGRFKPEEGKVTETKWVKSDELSSLEPNISSEMKEGLIKSFSELEKMTS